MEIDQQTKLEDCKFQQTVDLTNTHFKNDFSCAGSTYPTGVSLDDAKIDRDLILASAVFLRDADFTHLEVGGDLEANGAWFGAEATFIGLKVGHSAAFDSGQPLPPLFTLRTEPATNVLAG